MNSAQNEQEEESELENFLYQYSPLITSSIT